MKNLLFLTLLLVGLTALSEKKFTPRVGIEKNITSVFIEGDSVEVLNIDQLGTIYYGNGNTLPTISIGDTGIVITKIDSGIKFMELSLIMQIIQTDTDIVIIDFRGIGKGVRYLTSENYSHIEKIE